jgi:hypothetical protein
MRAEYLSQEAVARSVGWSICFRIFWDAGDHGACFTDGRGNQLSRITFLHCARLVKYAHLVQMDRPFQWADQNAFQKSEFFVTSQQYGSLIGSTIERITQADNPCESGWCAQNWRPDRVMLDGHQAAIW